MELQQTTSGEYTIYIPSMDETYHSRNGAISEAKHVFLQEGMDRTTGNIRILEVGFGTGPKRVTHFTTRYGIREKGVLSYA